MSWIKCRQSLIRMSSMAFWNYLPWEDDEVKKWLADGDFESALGEDGTFEKKFSTD